MGKQGPLDHYLGCTHIVRPAPAESDKLRIEVAFDVRQYVRDSIKSYLEQTKCIGPLKSAQTPYLSDEETGIEPPGVHSKAAMSVLAQLLYCARLARPDFMLAINLLSRNFTTWTVYHDRSFHRVLEYAQYSQEYMLRGHVGSGAISQELYCDADHAGCKKTRRSTSGIWLELRSGVDSTLPVEWSSKRQGNVAYSTPEAELVALTEALREVGLPCRTLVEATALNKGLREMSLPIGILLEAATGTFLDISNQVPMTILEDNSATIVIAEKGRSPALRHLTKTHGISIMWLAEVCAAASNKIVHCPTLDQKGDGFTTALEKHKFLGMLKQLGIS